MTTMQRLGWTLRWKETDPSEFIPDSPIVDAPMPYQEHFKDCSTEEEAKADEEVLHERGILFTNVSRK